MLELRPNCEYCDKDLPPASSQARICTYECTFCAGCVDTVLSNVCPNCGGGFVARPVRPRTARRDGVSLGYQPASLERKCLSYSQEDIETFVASIREIPPATR